MTLARLLHLANSDPPFDCRREFYALKERLLRRHATPDGADIQCIPGRQCWGCDGMGVEAEYYRRFDDGDDDEFCERCGGTGWYKRPRWIVLYRFRWGGYTFHCPGEVSYEAPEPNVTRIHGRIEHADYGRRPKVAAIYLFAWCGQWRCVWRLMTASRPCGWQWHPVLILNQLLMDLKMKAADWKQRCLQCRRHTWGATTFVCQRCSDEQDALRARQASEEVPF